MRPAEADEPSALHAESPPIFSAFFGVLQAVGSILVKASKSPASEGYEPLLVKHGWSRIPARMMAQLIVRHGNRVFNEAKHEPVVRSALRALCNPYLKPLAKSRRIKDLLAAWRESHILETIFDFNGLDVFEFVRLLEAEHNSSGPCNPRLIALAELALTKPAKRGPKISAASEAHQFFMENIQSDLEIADYSWCSVSNSCVDPASKATEREFKLDSFDARPAFRRSSR